VIPRGLRILTPNPTWSRLSRASLTQRHNNFLGTHTGSQCRFLSLFQL